jgi:hypothetical protein
MKKLVDNVIEVDFDEIETYDFPLDEPFGLEINHEDVKYCFIIRLASDNKNLVCMGPGAQLRDARTSKGELITPPYFNRWSWFSKFDESFIAYADPTYFYDEKIRIGWFVGTRKTWYMEVVGEIIKRIASNQEIKINNILFYSSSAGGFASIALGTLIKGSRVLVNNTQFNIMNYQQYHIENLFRVLRKEFPDLTDLEIQEKWDYRLNVIELFKREGYVPPISYYINSISGPDLNNQCIPFVNELKELPQFDNDFTVHFYKEVSEKPHNPLPINVSVDILKEYMKLYLYAEEEVLDNTLHCNLIEANLKLAEENFKLNGDNVELGEENSRLKGENVDLAKEIESLNSQIDTLKSELEKKSSGKIKKFLKSL